MKLRLKAIHPVLVCLVKQYDLPARASEMILEKYNLGKINTRVEFTFDGISNPSDQ